MGLFPNFFRLTGRPEPPVARTDEAIIYFDPEEGSLMVSADGGAFAPVTGVDLSGLYELPPGGVPLEDLEQDVQDSLDRADDAVVSATDHRTMLLGTVELAGQNPTQIKFNQDERAYILGSIECPVALAHGDTLKVNPNGLGLETATLSATAGTSTSGASPSTNITAGIDNKFKISVDGDVAQTVTLDESAGNNGANIAAEMQTKIRALGGTKALVTVAWTTVYTITSAMKGHDSAVVVTRADDHNITEELKIGVADGGTELPGEGFFGSIANAEVDEIVAALNDDFAALRAVAVGNYVQIETLTLGADKSLAVDASSTLDTKLGIEGTVYGATGMGYAFTPADNYFVFLQLMDVTDPTDLALSTDNQDVEGFDIYCETAVSTELVRILVLAGEPGV